MGVDSLWYVLALTSVGYVPLPLLAAFVGWGAVAAQTGAVALGRYMPYPDAQELSERGPLRESIRQTVLLYRRARAGRQERPHLEAVEEQEAAEE